MSPTTKTGLIAFGIVGAAFVVCGGGFAALVLANRDKGTAPGSPSVGLFESKPRADKEGETWTLKDVVEHLNHSGIRAVKTQSADEYSDPHRYKIECKIEGENAGFWIIQYEDARTARDAAGAKGYQCWGRFCFYTNDQVWRRIRTALGA